MKAVMIDAPGQVKVIEVPRPAPSSGEVLVKLSCCGVCGTDLEKVHGEGITTRILGHEEVGEVVEVGEGVRDLRTGDRVYAHHHVPCGACELCAKGEETLCAEYSKHNLVPCGLAEFFIVPKYNVERGAILRLPDGLGFEEATFIEPLACCIRALKKAGVGGSPSVVVYGAGPVGLLHLKLLKRDPGTMVAVADVSQYRLGIALKMGADSAFNAVDSESRSSALSRLPRAPDLVIVATASTAALEDAMRTVGKGGTVLLFGAPRKGARSTLDLERFFLNGTKLVTSYASSEAETALALELIASGKVSVADMITHRFPLARSADAFAVADQQQCMKALIVA